MIKLKQHSSTIISYVAILIVGLIIGVTAGWTSMFISLIFNSNDNIFAVEGLAAFAGALFAFIFVRLGDFLQRYYESKRRHYNELCTLESLLIDCAGVIYDDLYLLPDMRRVMAEGNVSASILKPIPANHTYNLNLQNIDLINIISSLNYDIRRINDDIEAGMKWYTQLKDLYVTDKIKRDHYLANVPILIKNLKYIEAALKQTLEDSIRVQAITKLRLIIDKPLITNLLQFISRLSEQKTSEQEIQNEIMNIKSEYESSRASSQPKIRKISDEAEKIG